jgi:CRP-like cAMP-binding protein
MANTNNNVDPLVILPILKKIPLFSGLDETLHREIIQHIVMMYYPANYVLFKAGDEGDALYLVKGGRIEIFNPSKEEDDPSRKIAEISEGGFFGEMALVSASPRNASAKAVTDCEVFVLSKEDFTKLLNTNTVLAEQISATVVSRLNENIKNK